MDKHDTKLPNKLEGKKVLCICERGNSRSVALAWLLKDRYGIDAIACGAMANSPETHEVLMNWADVIIVVDKNLVGEFPYPQKLLVWDIGADRYFRGFDEGLIERYEEYYAQ